MRHLRLRTDDLLWRTVDDEIVALEARDSTYLSTNASGALLWQMLADGATREELVVALVEPFDLGRDEAAADVDRFVAELEAHGLLDG